eukprot:1152885-Pelagomonas_calceolata.AAC.2
MKCVKSLNSLKRKVCRTEQHWSNERANLWSALHSFEDQQAFVIKHLELHQGCTWKGQPSHPSALHG